MPSAVRLQFNKPLFTFAPEKWGIAASLEMQRDAATGAAGEKSEFLGWVEKYLVNARQPLIRMCAFSLSLSLSLFPLFSPLSPSLCSSFHSLSLPPSFPSLPLCLPLPLFLPLSLPPSPPLSPSISPSVSPSLVFSSPLCAPRLLGGRSE